MHFDVYKTKQVSTLERNTTIQQTSMLEALQYSHCYPTFVLTIFRQTGGLNNMVLRGLLRSFLLNMNGTEISHNEDLKKLHN